MSLVDASINVGNIITIVIVGSGAIASFVTIRNNVSGMKSDMSDLKQEIKKVTEVLISLARQEERANAADQRALLQGQRIDELRGVIGRMESGRFDALCDQLNKLIVEKG